MAILCYSCDAYYQEPPVHLFAWSHQSFSHFAAAQLNSSPSRDDSSFFETNSTQQRSDSIIRRASLLCFCSPSLCCVGEQIRQTTRRDDTQIHILSIHHRRHCNCHQSCCSYRETFPIANTIRIALWRVFQMGHGICSSFSFCALLWGDPHRHREKYFGCCCNGGS